LTEKLSFAVENIEFLEEENNSQFATLKIDAFASGPNRHDLYISDETLKKTAPTIIQKPIMWAYNRRTDDASSHDDAEIICGFIPHDTPIDFRKLEDGRTMMSVIGKLWTRYSDKLMDIFHRDSKKSVSVEMEVYEEADNAESGLQEILNFCYTGITVLGSMVSPAIPLANAELVAFACKEKEDYERALLEFSNKYGSIDMSIPKEVKSNANKGLELYKRLGMGGNSISLAVARHLIKSDIVSIDKVKAIHKFLTSRKNIPKNRNNPDNEYVAWMLHGGTHAMEWSKKMVDDIKEIDEKQLSYFDDGELLTFPYKSIGDAPENMKKLDGVSLSLDQINQISKVADAIGVNKEKNGYAIAKAQFKKSHHVEGDRWVKNKSEMSDDEVEEFTFAKKDLGKGVSLKVDKSKEKVSNTPWGNVDKTSLMHKVLDASNYKSLVHDVYLVVEDGWEDHPSSSLKYPIMQLVGDTFVYNKAGLSAALGRAKGQGENSVASKVESIQTKLGLGKTEKEELSVDKKEKDLEEDKKEPEKEEMAVEKEKPESEEEEKKEQEEEGEDKKETAKEEAKEEAEEKKEGKEEKMSLDSNLDVSAYLAFLEATTEANEEMVAKYKTGEEFDYAKIFAASKERMCKMADELAKAKEDNDAYMSMKEEFEVLKKFKVDTESAQVAYAVESTIAEASDVLPKEKMEEFRGRAKEYSLETVSGLTNEIKAFAFSCSKDKKSSDGITRYDTGWIQNKQSNSLEHGWVPK
jgi:hypothetical protein